MPATLPCPAPDVHSWAEGLFRTHEAALRRYAHSLSRDPEAAKEAVQETFLRLLQQDPARLAGHEAAWLFRVCRTRVLDGLRSLRRHPEAGETASPVLDPGPSPLAQAEMSEEHARLLAQVERLPENQREVVRLRFQSGLSYDEIAAMTGLSSSNVGFLLHTAMQTLRRRLAGSPS